MLRIEVDHIQAGRKLILETEEDIRVEDLIRKTGSIFGESGSGMLISCDKEGVLPPAQTLSGLNIVSGERLLYLGRN